ncbi:MAG TPA: SDR family NAD(P)-dependent oxidoreductase, partial [Polyangiaceae bacterium LLY-WYZ-15_(1-7)]|nr:SDR family NAD(P)-dependent oxidoreductase [Polyangiaceae bacterium LLY-WYZ-15_(1-7)]
MVRRMAKRFEGQVAWITGGGSGIGKALALELAREGAHVAVSGRREARLQEVAREVSAIGG